MTRGEKFMVILIILSGLFIAKGIVDLQNNVLNLKQQLYSLQD